MNMKRLFFTTSILSVSILSTVSMTYAESSCVGNELVESGKVHGTATTVGLLIGYRWGEGEVTFNDGSKRIFTMRGMKLLDNGITTVKFSGSIYNLSNIEDFAGSYTGVDGGVALGTLDSGYTNVTNENCVVLSVKPTSEGIRLSPPGPTGIQIFLEE